MDSCALDTPHPMTTEARNALIEEYSGQAHAMVRSFCRRLPTWIDRDALQQAAMLGLVIASHRFDPSLQRSFIDFAQHHIYGGMRDHLRTFDWTSRSVRKWQKRINSTRAMFLERWQAEATRDEIREELGLSVEEYHRIRYRSAQAMVPLEVLGEDQLPHEGKTPEMETSLKENIAVLASAMTRLNPRLQTIVTLYYYYEMSLADIGRMLNLTEGRICQLHADAITQLRTFHATPCEKKNTPQVFYPESRPEYRQAKFFAPRIARMQ